MIEKLHDNMLLIMPLFLKEKLLEKLAQIDLIYDIKFFSLEEIKEKYFFKVKEEALLFLLEETKEPLSIIKEMLSYLYVIDPKEEYHHPKLKYLQTIKNKLEENHLLDYDPTFLDYIKNKELVVYGYTILEPYEKNMLTIMNARIVPPVSTYPLQEVVHYETMRQEVEGVFGQIRRLNEQGVSYDHIFISGVIPAYHYLLEQVSRQFDVPLYLPKQNPLASTIAGKTFLETKQLEGIPSSLESNILVILAQVSFAEDSPYYDLFLKDAFHHHYLEEEHPLEAVTVSSQYLEYPSLLDKEDYLFVLGLNQNHLPTIYKDEHYLSDYAKRECQLYLAKDWNQQRKKQLKQVLETVPNLVLSYKDTSLTESFYPSSFIAENHLKQVEGEKPSLSYSEQYNYYQHGLLLEEEALYHDHNPRLSELNAYCDETSYKDYCHDFKAFTYDPKKITLSYSSIDDYALCPFRYYAKHILKLEPYDETFAQKIGIIYHQVLSEMYQPNFNFYQSFTKAKENVTLSSKETFLLRRLEEELAFIIKTIQEAEKVTFLKEKYLEKRIEIPIDETITLKGFIDKIMYYEKGEQTYYAVFDYKTGSIHLDLSYVKDLLHIQLPIYAYLVEKSKLFKAPVLAGFFYQSIISSKQQEEEKKKDLKVMGVTSSSFDTLAILDETYEKSDWIKGLSVTKNGSLSTRSKTISQEEKEALFTFFDQALKDLGNNIKQCQFSIAPKIVQTKNISCTYCPFAAVCFHDQKDNQYIQKEDKEVE